MFTRRCTCLVLLLSVVGTGCQDLDVVNENNPDTERALSSPAAVEALIASQFTRWFGVFNDADVHGFFPMYADEMTATTPVRGIQASIEPREPIINEPMATDEQNIQRSLWDTWNGAAGNINAALKRIDRGMRLVTLDPGAASASDNTDRAYAFAKVLQGLTLGYIALSADRAAPATEDTDLPIAYHEVIAWERANIRPYAQVMTVAIAALDEAIQRVDAGAPFTTPPSWVNGQALTSDQLRQWANTIAARMLIYNARTPAERAVVDWNRVLAYTAAGLTFDIAPRLTTGLLASTYLDRIQSTTRLRADYRLIGPADVSGDYQAWLARPIAERTRFRIVTPDRRISNATGTGSGAYFRYRQPTDNSGFDVTRGLAYFSNYQWYRYNGATTDLDYVLFSADENRLYRAEAMLRLGRVQEAADLINVTRTRAVRVGTSGTATTSGLPPVTDNGVPASTSAAPCVPRTPTGACGSLMDALRYERQIELAGIDPVRAWMDYRGFGQLLDGTAYHMPIAARYLVSLTIPLYTFGGIGGAGSAQCTAGC